MTTKELKKRAKAAGIAFFDHDPFNPPARPFNHPRGCKIGTIPMLASIHGGDKKKFAPGNWVRVKIDGERHYTTVLVNRINDDRWFQADR